MFSSDISRKIKKSTSWNKNQWIGRRKSNVTRKIRGGILYVVIGSLRSQVIEQNIGSMDKSSFLCLETITPVGLRNATSPHQKRFVCQPFKLRNASTKNPNLARNTTNAVWQKKCPFIVSPQPFCICSCMVPLCHQWYSTSRNQTKVDHQFQP